MQSVRLAKMEGYGFAVRLLAPVTPVRKSTDSTAEPYALYERSVVPILQESLETLCLAEQKAREGGSAELFEKSAAREDLAKLCAALTGIRKALDSKCLEIGITYSATRSQHLPCARICVEERYFPVIEAVSNAIRENDLEAGRL